MPVETEAELEVAAWREENTTWEWDQEKYDELQRTVGDLGAPTMFMPRMNVQSLYINQMGVERGIYAIRRRIVGNRQLATQTTKLAFAHVVDTGGDQSRGPSAL